MFFLSKLPKKILDKIQKRAYRRSYVAEHLRRGVAYQIRELREQRGWSQGKLSSFLKKPQSVVSRLEDPSYGKFSLQSLLEVADAFDVALQVRFVSYSAFLQQTRDVSAPALQVPSFAEDAGLRPSVAENVIEVPHFATETSSSVVVAGMEIDEDDPVSSEEVFSNRNTAGVSAYVH